MAANESHCPICNTNYSPLEVDYCPTCGWLLTNYPVVLGEIPKIFQQRLQEQLKWAKKLWQSHIEQLKAKFQELTSTQTELAESNSKLLSVEQEKAATESKLNKSLQEQASFKQQLRLVKAEKMELEEKLNQVLQELQPFYQPNGTEDLPAVGTLKNQLSNMELLLQLSRKLLNHWLPELNSNLAQEIYQIQDEIKAVQDIHHIIESPSTISSNEQLITLKTIMNILADQTPKSVDKIVNTLEEANFEDVITRVDALLFVRWKLKSEGIIKRDSQGDTLL